MFKPQPVALQQGALRLDPLTEADLPGLLQLAEANRASQQFMSGTTRPDWYRSALAEQREGREVVFAIRLAGELVGTTSFFDFNPVLPAAEIGATWLDVSQHVTVLNRMIKYLMLRHAFEEWQLVRVQLKTAASNLRAQRAIEILFVLCECLLRNHRRLADGRLDHSVMYSITDSEWPQVKVGLESCFGA